MTSSSLPTVSSYERSSKGATSGYQGSTSLSDSERDWLEKTCGRIEGCSKDASRLDHIFRDHLHDGATLILYLVCDMILFLVSILLSAVPTRDLSIWIPVSIFLGCAVVHVGYQEVKHRPGVLGTLKKPLFSHGNAEGVDKPSDTSNSAV